MSVMAATKPTPVVPGKHSGTLAKFCGPKDHDLGADVNLKNWHNSEAVYRI